MSNLDLAARLAQKAYLKQDLEKQQLQSSGVGNADFSNAGPPMWDRAAWEGFRAQYGYYPFGNQNGSMIMPPSFVGAPDWVYQLMNLRKPPVTVGS